MFADRLKKIFETAGFWKLCFYKVIWNITGRKFQALCIALILIFITKKVDSNILFITIAAYAGLNIAEKIFSKGGGE